MTEPISTSPSEPQEIHLSKEDFYWFRMVSLEAEQTLQRARTMVQQAQESQEKCLATLSERYNFDPKATTFDYNSQNFTITPKKTL